MAYWMDVTTNQKEEERVARRYFTIQAVLAIILFLLVHATDSIEDSPVFQRCNLPVANSSYGHGWETSTCLACQSSHVAQIGSSDAAEEGETSSSKPKKVNVLIQITVPKLEPEFLNLAAGLLMAQHNVTLYYMSFHRGTIDDFSLVLRRSILSRLPCSHNEPALHRRLKIRPIDIAGPIREYCSKRIVVTVPFHEPIQSCIGVAAPAQYRLYSRVFRNLEDLEDRIPDVVVTDLHGYGLLFIAEEFGIPSLILEDQHSFYESTGHRRGQDASWRRIMDIMILGTIRAVMGTKTFTDVSRFRSILGLKRLKHRGAVWNSATAVAILGHEFNATAPEPKPSFPPVMHLRSPIFPPCFTCLGDGGRESNATSTQQTTGNVDVDTKTVTLLFLPPPDLAVSWGQEVTRGLSMARRSLLSYEGVCDKSSASSSSGTSNCWHDRMDLRVIWMVDTEMANYWYRPPSRPPHWIHIQNASLFLDDMLHYATKTSDGPTIVMAQCDDDARVAVLMQVPILCLATRGTQQSRVSTKVRHLRNFQAREIAMRIVNLVWDLRGIDLNPTFSLDDTDRSSLSRLIAAVETAGGLITTPIWPLPEYFVPKKAMELQGSFSVAIQGHEVLITGNPKELSPANTMIWWVACVTLGLSTVLVFVTCILPVGAKLIRPNNNNNNSDQNSFWNRPKEWLEAWLGRFPEMNMLWDSVKRLWKDENKAPARPATNKRVNKKSSNGGARASAIKASETLHRRRSDKHR